MTNYTLPTEIIINDISYSINRNGDYRMVLDVISAMNDEKMDNQEKAYCALCIFYDFNIPQNAQKAIDEMMLFINCGEAESNTKDKPPVMSWEKDFSVLAAPINRVLGTEIRSVPYLHWWTFIGGYMEIGECRFANIVNIRTKIQKGQKLEKWEREFYNENRSVIDLKPNLKKEEQEFIDNILGINVEP